jgi:hypothetical protein
MPEKNESTFANALGMVEFNSIALGRGLNR